MIRRSLRILSIYLVLALFCCLLGYAETGVAADSKVASIEEIVAGMSLRDKLAQMMFFSPRGWKEDSAC